MNARSALFDLYGDHLRQRGGRAPVAALVRLLAPLGVAAPAVRTAVSRMARQGWLEPVRLAGGAGYALTPRAVRRLDDAAARIYRTQPASGDGRWHLVVTGALSQRSRRDRVRAGMTFLGYAALDDGTWLGPRASAEVDVLLDAEGVRAERFAARHEGDSGGLVRRAWDLEGLGRSHRRWLDDAQAVTADAPAGSADESPSPRGPASCTKWRKFLFLDPGLPAELLPAGWPGGTPASDSTPRAPACCLRLPASSMPACAGRDPAGSLDLSPVNSLTRKEM